jgi:UDP-glucuronate 4-epimerase
MAPHLFTRHIVDGTPIQVFNHGQMRRDFTYVGDIVEGIVRVFSRPPLSPAADDLPAHGSLSGPFRIYNLGRGAPVDLLEFIREIEILAGKKAQIVLTDHQAGDVEETYADVSGLQQEFDYQPGIDLKHGLKAWWEWFQEYYLAGK